MKPSFPPCTVARLVSVATMRPKLAFLLIIICLYLSLCFLVPDRTKTEVILHSSLSKVWIPPWSRPKRINNIDGKTGAIKTDGQTLSEEESGMALPIRVRLLLSQSRPSIRTKKKEAVESYLQFRFVEELCWPSATAIARGRTTSPQFVILNFSFPPTHPGEEALE